MDKQAIKEAVEKAIAIERDYWKAHEKEAVEIDRKRIKDYCLEEFASKLNHQQVILIGDAPPNSRELVIQGRQQYLGLKYWETTRFSRSTYVDDEVQGLSEFVISAALVAWKRKVGLGSR